jgi:hypothetical protein
MLLPRDGTGQFLIITMETAPHISHGWDITHNSQLRRELPRSIPHFTYVNTRQQRLRPPDSDGGYRCGRGRARRWRIGCGLRAELAMASTAMQATGCGLESIAMHATAMAATGQLSR